MANLRRSNSWFVDATGLLSSDSAQVAQIILTSSGAGDTLLLSDGSTSYDKISLKATAANSSYSFSFSPPIIFQSGIYVETLSAGAKATLVLAS
jgi:hypothetical protein